jgi:hypothetical protein
MPFLCMQLSGVREIGSNVLKNTSETSICEALSSICPVGHRLHGWGGAYIYGFLKRNTQQNRACRHYSKVDCPQHRLEEQKDEVQGLRVTKNI